jgi:negative regulator of flagellin synthesis FlgM
MGIGIGGDLPAVSQIQGKEKMNRTYNGYEISRLQPKKDNIEISNISKDYNVAAIGLRDVPDVREEKIKELQEKIHEGTYNINEEEVANKFFDYIQTKQV